MSYMGKPDNEYTFMLIDASDSMFERSIAFVENEESGKKKKKKKKKKKGGPLDYITRYEAAIEASKIIVKTKKNIVDTDRFGIIVFNDKGARLVQEITNDHDILLQKLDSLQSSLYNEQQNLANGNKGLRSALALTIQEFAKQLKFIGNLMLRIFILSDDMHYEGISQEERKLTEVARDIGVYIDILHFGLHPENMGIDEEADAAGYFKDETFEASGDGGLGLDFTLDGSTFGPGTTTSMDKSELADKGLILPGIQPEDPTSTATRPTPVNHSSSSNRLTYKDIRLISTMTDGLFLDGQQNTAKVYQHAKKLGDIKDLEEGLGAFESPPVRKKKLMSAIAEELVPLGLGEMQDELEGKSDLKCQICFQKQDPHGVPFYASGRRCSYCQREMHMACAAKWAAQDQGSEETFIFRCPFCFHLLKVDPAVSKLMDLQIIRQNIAKKEASRQNKMETFASILQPSQILNLIEPCNVCGVLLEDDDMVYQCNNCGAAYHEKCFKATLEENELHCRKCGYLFKKWG